MRHKHIIEIRQNHPIQLNMCPTNESLNVMAVLWLEGYSSNGMRIVNSQRRVIASDCEEFLILSMYTKRQQK